MPKDKIPAPSRFRGFFNRNLVTIVMVPVLILVHWGWDQIQKNEIFVKPEDRQPLPSTLAYEKIKQKLLSTSSSS